MPRSFSGGAGPAIALRESGVSYFVFSGLESVAPPNDGSSRRSATSARLSHRKSNPSFALGVCWTHGFAFATPCQPPPGNNRPTEHERTVFAAERARCRRTGGFRCACQPLGADHAGIVQDAGLPSRTQGLVGQSSQGEAFRLVRIGCGNSTWTRKHYNLLSGWPLGLSRLRT